MDNQQNPFLSWPYFFQGKTMEELSQSLLLTTLELENTRVRAEEELKMRDDQLVELRNLLEKTIRDRDEAQEKCEKLLLDQLLLQQQQQQQQIQLQLQKFHCKNQIAPHSGISSIEDDTKNANFSSSDCEESIVSSPILEVIQEKDQDFYSSLTTDKPLPEKGKLLEAVMKAGPLLQTLLLAGPLPNWRHPPPPLETYQIPIPPVIVQPPPPPPQQFQLPHQDSLMDITTFSNINNFGRVNKKREFCDVTDYSIETMYKKRLSLIS